MRTRNKTVKDQPGNKRPKRGADTPDTPNEVTKTPNKTSEKRKSTRETPTKAKKRTNADLDTDNDGSDEKDKRKRTESPTESLNSDSRPGSVIDEQDNTNEPPDTVSTDVDIKDVEIKKETKEINDTVNFKEENNSIDTDKQIKSSSEENSSNDDSNLPVKKSLPDKTENLPQNIATNDKEPSSNIETTATATIAVTVPPNSVVTTAIVPKDEPKREDITTKEEDISNAIANMKQENILPMVTKSTTVPTESKDSMFIKEEPRDESVENANNSNSNSNEPHDLKLVADIKSENKCGLDLSDHDNKTEDKTKSIFNSQIKYALQPPPIENNIKYTDPTKCSEPIKLNQEIQSPLKYSNQTQPLPLDQNKFGGDRKPLHEQIGKYPENMDIAHIKPENSPFISSDSIKIEGQDPIKRIGYSEPLQTIRSPYDAMMQKYASGLPTAPIPPSGIAQNLKYGIPSDLQKYRSPENLSKSQFTADNLMKGAPGGIYGEYAPGAKYPPSESPIDASARSTPNQDSQSSNSNLPPTAPPHNANLPPLHSNSPHHVNQSQPHLSILGMAPHLPPLSHLPPGHPAAIAASSSPSAITSITNIISTPPAHHGLPLTTTTSSIQVQPLSLLGGPNSQQNQPGLPPPGLHRPGEIPHLHPGAGSGAFNLSGQGIPPPMNASRAELERNEQQRRLEGMQQRASPNMMSVTSVPQLLGHPGMSLHMPHNLSAGQLPILPSPHHPVHLGPPLIPSSIPGVNSALSLIGGPQLNSTPVGLTIEGRRTPTSAPYTSAPPSSTSQTSSAFSRTSPSVQFSHPSAHRQSSPPQTPSNLTRSSPMHLPHHSTPGPNSSSAALSAAAAAAAERDRQAHLRQQSPHMTPPPTSSSSLSMMSTPLNKIYQQSTPTSQSNQTPTSQQSSQNRSLVSSSPPPSMSQHHIRPGTSPPVIRPQMPLPLPLMSNPGTIPTPIGMHPHNPYSHHLIHPLFYPHQHNPFNSPYPYQPYPPNFQYLKPPTAAGMDPSMLPHHPGQVSSRCEESPSLNDKNSSSNMQHKIKPPTQKTPQGTTPGSGNSSTAFSSPHAYQLSSHSFNESPGTSKTSHIDALRAHAHSASSGLGSHHSTEPVHVDIEPDPEPEIPSPTHNIPRGPSPEAKPDDTECHRSQSAM